MDIADEVKRLFACDIIFRPPATVRQISDVENRLGCSLPDDLRNLYLAFNGILGLGTSILWPLVRADSPTCSVEQINEIYRRYTMVPDKLREIVFYGSTTGESSLGYRLSDNTIVTYDPTIPDRVAPFADSIVSAYRRDLVEWNRP